MGFGASKIDYKERNFTEQPLEEEEIDILLQALPEENIINSIESEGREKILKAMSDQKVFNIRGDNIFDYYFNNNKEAIKGCMTNQFTREGTPCPDEKFNRMITTIPDLVQGPLGEKENQWDTQKTGLEKRYNTLNTKHDTLQQKRQQNLEALALDGFLANPEMYNKMLMEKMSQKALDIFTKDGDIDINVKEFVEHSSIKSTLDRSYKEKKTVIPGFVEGFKKQASNLLNNFNKEAADGVKSQMPPIGFLMTLIQMKIAVQYSGSDKTKIAPNRTLYNYFSEFFDELGIGTNNIEYTLKFITFNTFKKFMEYDLKNDVKGIDLHLQDFLKLIKEFGGEEYLNSLSNFEIDTGLKGSYNTLNTEKTELQLQYETLNDSNTELKKQYDTLNTQKGDLQTQYDTLNTQKNTLQGQYDTLITQTSSSQIQQKALEVKVKKMKEVVSNLTSNFIITNNEQSPKLTIPKELCKLYATNKGYNFAIASESGNPKGCFIQKPNMVYYNRNKDSTTKCNAHNGVSQCIEDESKYFLEVHNEYENVMNVSKEQCDRIAKSKYGDDKIASEQNWSAVPEGCVDHFSGGSMYFNKHKGKKCDSNDGYNCIQNPINPKDYDYNRIDYPNFSVSEAECAAFAESKGMGFYNNEVADYPQGCYVSLSGKGYVRYNPKRSEKRCSTGGAGYACIQKKSVPYKLTSVGKPRLTVSKDECKDYSKKIGAGFAEGGFSDKRGCFLNTNNKKVYYSTYTNTNNDCTTEKPCIELNESLTKYKEVTSGKPDMSVSEEECKAYSGSLGKGGFMKTTWDIYPNGCFDNTTGGIYFNKGTADCASDRICIQKHDPVYGKFKQSQLNRRPLNNVGENECQGYAKHNKFNWKGNSNNSEPKGCFLNKNKDVWYNLNMASTGSCDYLLAHAKHKCIEKEVNKDDFILKHSGTPVGDVNKEECMQYAIINNKEFSNINNTSNPAGCFIHTGNKPSNVYFNSKAASTTACDSNKRCIIKNKQNYNLKEVTSGKNDDSVNDDECKGYAKSQGVKWVSCPGSYTGVPKGCGSDIANGVKEFKFCLNGTADCNNTNTCVQKGSSLYYGINSGKPDLSLSESECEQWAKDNNKTWGNSVSYSPTGGYVNGCFYQTFNNTVKFNKGASNNHKCSYSYNCIQKKEFGEASSGKPDLSVTEADCKAYADSINYDWDKVYNYNTNIPRGCVKDTVFIKFNPSDSNTQKCSSSFKCIKRK